MTIRLKVISNQKGLRSFPVIYFIVNVVVVVNVVVIVVVIVNVVVNVVAVIVTSDVGQFFLFSVAERFDWSQAGQLLLPFSSFNPLSYGCQPNPL